jgi:hypothetical protein
LIININHNFYLFLIEFNFKPPNWLKNILFIDSKKLLFKQNEYFLQKKENNIQISPIKCLIKKENTKPSNHEQDQNQNILLKKLVKQVKKKMRKINLENTQNKLKAEINMEWKEVARRLDQFFLVISLITIIIVPAYLFGEYAFRDFFEKIESQKAKCGCEK